jgi:hypothetical protein
MPPPSTRDSLPPPSSSMNIPVSINFSEDAPDVNTAPMSIRPPIPGSGDDD